MRASAARILAAWADWGVAAARAVVGVTAVPEAATAAARGAATSAMAAALTVSGAAATSRSRRAARVVSTCSLLQPASRLARGRRSVKARRSDSSGCTSSFASCSSAPSAGRCTARHTGMSLSAAATTAEYSSTNTGRCASRTPAASCPVSAWNASAARDTPSGPADAATWASGSYMSGSEVDMVRPLSLPACACLAADPVLSTTRRVEPAAGLALPGAGALCALSLAVKPAMAAAVAAAGLVMSMLRAGAGVEPGRTRAECGTSSREAGAGGARAAGLAGLTILENTACSGSLARLEGGGGCRAAAFAGRTSWENVTSICAFSLLALAITGGPALGAGAAAAAMVTGTAAGAAGLAGGVARAAGFEGLTSFEKLTSIWAFSFRALAMTAGPALGGTAFLAAATALRSSIQATALRRSSDSGSRPVPL
mmetsp:Transcript_3281/g.8156  ORF Transcript_3281/g.8156 Transcript_3281/m.8156 type:complete len:428 (-) Transcript_3281:413-1696(-)